MNDYWNHEPEFFWYKKKSEKVRNFLTQRSDPPPSSRFFEKIPDVIFLRPLMFTPFLVVTGKDRPGRPHDRARSLVINEVGNCERLSNRYSIKVGLPY